jgi:hypothetical protein
MLGGSVAAALAPAPHGQLPPVLQRSPKPSASPRHGIARAPEHGQLVRRAQTSYASPAAAAPAARSNAFAGDVLPPGYSFVGSPGESAPAASVLSGSRRTVSPNPTFFSMPPPNLSGGALPPPPPSPTLLTSRVQTALHTRRGAAALYTEPTSVLGSALGRDAGSSAANPFGQKAPDVWFQDMHRSLRVHELSKVAEVDRSYLSHGYPSLAGGDGPTFPAGPSYGGGLYSTANEVAGGSVVFGDETGLVAAGDSDQSEDDQGHTLSTEGSSAAAAGDASRPSLSAASADAGPHSETAGSHCHTSGDQRPSAAADDSVALGRSDTHERARAARDLSENMIDVEGNAEAEAAADAEMFAVADALFAARGESRHVGRSPRHSARARDDGVDIDLAIDDYQWGMRTRLAGGADDHWMAIHTFASDADGADKAANGGADVGGLASTRFASSPDAGAGEMTREELAKLIASYKLSDGSGYDDALVRADAAHRMAACKTSYELAAVLQSADDVDNLAAVLIETDDVLYEAEVQRERVIRRERAAQRVRAQRQLAWYCQTYGEETGKAMYETAREQRVKATKPRLTLGEMRKRVAVAEHALKYVSTEFMGYVITSITVVMFMIHPNITKQFFMVLSCKSVGGVADPGASFMLGDLTEPCYSSQHVLFILVLGAPMFFAWVLGIPLFAFYILHKNRHLIQAPVLGTSAVVREQKRNFESQMAFIYRGYKPTRYYWFLMEMGRKVVLVAISVFFPGALHTQLMLASLLIFVCILTQIAFQPFENRIPGAVEFISLGTSFMIFFLANFLFVDTVSDAAKVAATVLIVALVFFFFAVVVIALIILMREEASLAPLRVQLREAYIYGHDIGHILRRWRVSHTRGATSAGRSAEDSAALPLSSSASQKPSARGKHASKGRIAPLFGRMSPGSALDGDAMSAGDTATPQPGRGDEHRRGRVSTAHDTVLTLGGRSGSSWAMTLQGVEDDTRAKPDEDARLFGQGNVSQGDAEVLPLPGVSGLGITAAALNLD